MINEVAYCPRLYALEHVNHEWADSVDTSEGRRVHRRVDQPSKEGLPEPEDDPLRPVVSRSVSLGCPDLRLTAKIDLVEVGDGTVRPVEYKKGRPPDTPEQAWEPERVQVAVQVLLLRAHGYDCPGGDLYFAASKQRVAVDVDAALEARVLALRDEAERIRDAEVLPLPLVDSPKCRGCSLVGICLPDEHHHLAAPEGERPPVRPLIPARDDAIPLYVQVRGGSLGKKKDEIVVREKGEEVARARFEHTSRVILVGHVSVSSAVLSELGRRGIPLAVQGYGGWLHGIYQGATGPNVLSRIAQHRVAADEALWLPIARDLVTTKIKNSRVLLRRNARQVSSGVLARLKDAAEQAEKASDADTLRGYEGNAARLYFEAFPKMLRVGLGEAFDMDGRNRRPPKDPVNALLSFAYACLARECANILSGIGLDAWVGLLHRPRHGRLGLALDLMEPFRPIVADSAVINALNNEVVREEHFLIRPTGTVLTSPGRRAFLGVLERRFDELVTHPVFDTRLSYRRVLEVEARLLAKVFLGELDRYPGFRVR